MEEKDNLFRGWYKRNKLPHADFIGLTQAITFRLADSMPLEVLQNIQEKVRNNNLSKVKSLLALQKHIQYWIDKGYGSCLLQNKKAQEILIDLFYKKHTIDYILHAFVIMPNHAHILVTVNGNNLDKITKAWKGSSSKKINEIYNNKGKLWQKESFDRFIRDEQHMINALMYIRDNPKKLPPNKYALYIDQVLLEKLINST